MEVEAKGGGATPGRGVGSGAVGDLDAGGGGVGIGGGLLGLEGLVKGGGVGKERGRGGGVVSDDDEPSFDGDGGEGGGHGGGGKSKKSSPWQRMKWTDSMVKLLIGVVLFIGEDGVVEGNEGNNKRKSGILQKKGKWKSVSRVMMEKGCYVSPQQCEDKFNDLNKRYKRLNDILGKNIACNVVENPSTLDGMSNLAPKSREDVKKILSSKHLFYKEMAFYHSGNKAALSTDLEFQPSLQALTLQSREMIEGARHMRDDMEEDDDDDDEDEGDDDDVEDEYDLADGVEEDGDAIADLSDPLGKRRKLSKKLEEVELGLAASGLHEYVGGKEITGVEIMNTEMVGVLQDGSKVSREHQQWMRSRTMQLEEQKVGLQAEAFNLEKQRFKWQKFSCKKDREIERMRLENERIKLENERMALQLKQKELEIDHRRSEASMTSIALILDRLQERDQNELERGQCVQ